MTFFALPKYLQEGKPVTVKIAQNFPTIFEKIYFVSGFFFKISVFCAGVIKRSTENLKFSYIRVLQ